MALQLPIEQRIDKSYIHYQEKIIIEYLKDECGLLRTPQGEEILRKLRQIQMAVDQQLKNKVEFQKLEKNQEKEDLQQLQHKLQELKQKQKDEFAILGDLQSQLKQKVQNTIKIQKFKQLLHDIENQDFREILVDDKTIEESLNAIFLEHLTKNQTLIKEQVEQIKYVKEIYEQQYREQQQLKERLQLLQKVHGNAAQEI
ncbi:unnamed protein product [Paramecium pentaurelia]|uniref:Uncharacterized protein n=1 Tax=Paramecium pentaurelia TaxID=43138 RepID=A0A8S1UBN9_9CILI|nr:unnamed protein product [Paramecium pentaurelia]